MTVEPPPEKKMLNIDEVVENLIKQPGLTEKHQKQLLTNLSPEEEKLLLERVPKKKSLTFFNTDVACG